MKYFKLKATLILAMLLCNISASAYTEIWQKGIRYTLGNDGTAAVSGIYGITAAIIPEKVTYDGMEYAVTSIEEYALSFCTSLVSVVIPCSVTSIGDGTFGNCTGLVSVDIPNSVTSIGDNAFMGCESLASIVIPNSVTYIGDYAFCECTSLASVVIPSSVTDIGRYAFWKCSSLASVVIPNSVAGIGDAAFGSCTRLASIVIPNSVTSIRASTFQGCTGLVSADIPCSVTSIGDGAFTSCNSLKKLVCHATTPPVFDDELWGAFVGVDKNVCTLYVPQESIDAYMSATHWKDFFNITTGIKGVPNTSSSATESARYSTDGTRIASPQKGINIIRMSDGTVKKVLVK